MLKNVVAPLFLLASLAVQAADNAEIKKQLEVIMPGVSIDSISPVDNTGMIETVINGEIVYFSQDLRYVFQGDVVSLQTRQNLTENKRVSLRKQALSTLNETDMIIYSPEKVEHTITVFTDIDCGYCRKLHQEMAGYNDLGIAVRYLAFPRAGIDSESFDKAANVWCATDRQQAMDDAKNGNAVTAESCDNPIQAQYELGRKIGVQGTPALFLESGQMLPGYVPPKRLKQILDEQVSAKF